MTLQIFLECISPREPAREVKSWANRPAIDPAKPGDDSIGRDFHLFHAEIDAAMFDKNICFPEGARIKEQIQAFPGRKLAAFMLLFHSLGAAHGLDPSFPFIEFLKLVSHGFHEKLLSDALLSPAARAGQQGSSGDLKG